MQTQVDIKSLRSAAEKSPKLKALFDLYGKRIRGRQDSSIPRQRRVLKEAGVDFSAKELIDFYALMQKSGGGRWVSGRHGKPGRFVWAFNLRSIADAVNGYRYEAVKVGKGQYEYRKVALTGKVELEAAPTKRVRLPSLATAPAGASVSPAPIAPTKADGGRTFTVKRGDFEINLPFDMNEAEQKDAALFLTNLERLG